MMVILINGLTEKKKLIDLLKKLIIDYLKRVKFSDFVIISVICEIWKGLKFPFAKFCYFHFLRFSKLASSEAMKYD